MLRLPTAHVERSTAALDDAPVLQALFDDNPDTVARLRTQPGAPLDVVFGFEGATVTADRLLVQLPESSSTARVEVLVSTLSPQAGFRSLRVDLLAARTAVQEFRFQPAAARWIMLRFTPTSARAGIDVVEVKVFGHEGAPAASYAFKQSPAAAFEVLARLKDLSAADTSLSADERSLFADAADGSSHQWSLEDAALVASGLRNAPDRAPYLVKLAAIEASAAGVIGAEGTAFDRGDKLLRWLYRSGALKSYSKDKTDLSALLDSGDYNCVSSALLYAIVGRRLGLDVRAVEVPDHAFAVVYDGTLHADVETTIESGFNPDRDARSLSFFERLTGFRRPPQDKRELRREVHPLGLAAAIYYNHGVGHNDAGRNPQALGDYFRALSLDPENASAVQNNLATLGNWSVELIRAEHFQEAVQELAAGLALAPDDPRLNDNYLATWQRWATAEIQAGRRDEALAVLRKAAQAAPKGNFEAMETWVYISPAEEQAKRDRWQEAVAIVDAARTGFSGQQLADLENYEAGLYNRQAMYLIDRKHWPEAQAVYAAAEIRIPGSDLLKQNEKFVWSSWCIEDEQAGDIAGMVDVARRARQRFPDDVVLSGNLRAAWLKVSMAQADKGDFEAAQRSIADALDHFPGDSDLKRVEHAHWVNWSKALIDGKGWVRAIEVCERGLKRFPADSPLIGNELAAWFNAGQAEFAASRWKEAVDIYTRARTRFPDDQNLRGNELAAWSNWSVQHGQAGRWQEAIDTLQQARLRFPDEPGLRKLELNAWINWGKALIDARQWQQALDVAGRGLKDDPDAELLKGNEVAAWGNWAKTFSEHGDWKAAIETLVQARSQFPADKNLQGFELYCWTSWVKSKSDQSDWAGALATVKMGLQRFPDDDHLLNALTFCQSHLNKT